MAKIKDILLIEDNEKEIFVEINNKLIPIVWVTDIGNIVVLKTKK